MQKRLSNLMPWLPTIIVAAAVALLAAVQPPPRKHAGPVRAHEGPPVIRIGFLPNVTHAQALLAQAGGQYDAALGGPVEWVPFSVGPLAIEAMFAGDIDAAYVGPNPAINGYLRSRGESFVVVSGAASGGAALVVAPQFAQASASPVADAFRTAIVATPQLGNTQDVAARNYFAGKGLATVERGGTLKIMPLSPADQLVMLRRGELDAAWTIEPWVSRLEQEAGGKVLLEESALWPDGRYATTALIVTRRFLQQKPELVRQLIAAHVDLTRTLNADKLAAAPHINKQLRLLTSKSLPDRVIESSLQRIEFTWDPLESTLVKSADDAFRIGFLRTKPDLTGLVDMTILKEIVGDAKDKMKSPDSNSSPASFSQDPLTPALSPAAGARGPEVR